MTLILILEETVNSSVFAFFVPLAIRFTYGSPVNPFNSQFGTEEPYCKYFLLLEIQYWVYQGQLSR